MLSGVALQGYICNSSKWLLVGRCNLVPVQGKIKPCVDGVLSDDKLGK